MLFRTTCTLLLILCSLQIVTAQEPEGPSLVFGEVSIAELEKPESLIEQSASAEILGDYGNIDKTGKYVRFTRIKIYNQDGYSHANVEIPKYGNTKISKIRGFTYNLADGAVEKTPIIADQIIEETIMDQFKRITITFPKVKPGAVLDLEIVRKFKQGYAINEWVFQRDIPVVWSELVLLKYTARKVIFFSQGLEPYTISEQKDVSKSSTKYIDRITHHRWARSNLKPIKSEPFISSINNFIAKIDFQYIGGSSYFDYNNVLCYNAAFNETINKTKFMKSALPAFDKSLSDLEKAKQIFAYIRDNMDWNGAFGKIPGNLRDAWKTKGGSVPTINYLLTAALQNNGLRSDPVILSTRKNGLLHPVYAVNNEFNYLVCGVLIGEEWMLLDASEKNHQFGILPKRCLNEKGWRLSKADPGWVSLIPKGYVTSATEAQVTMSKKGFLSGKIKNRYTSYQGYGQRQKLVNQGHKMYLKQKDSKLVDWEFSNLTVENEDDLSMPLMISYEIANAEKEGNNLIYLDPVITSLLNHNPFEAEARLMPINFPYRTLDRYESIIELPDNYTVEELPSPAILKTTDLDLFFQFSATAIDNKIQITSSLRINGLNYPVEEYPEVKSFFETVVNKQSEQIVLRRVE